MSSKFSFLEETERHYDDCVDDGEQELDPEEEALIRYQQTIKFASVLKEYALDTGLPLCEYLEPDAIEKMLEE